jgi:hypothetical protein
MRSLVVFGGELKGEQLTILSARYSFGFMTFGQIKLLYISSSTSKQLIFIFKLSKDMSSHKEADVDASNLMRKLIISS